MLSRRGPLGRLGMGATFGIAGLEAIDEGGGDF